MNSFHWLRAFLILLATCAVVVLLSSPAIAADHHGKHGKHQCPTYSDLDANADNAVTAEELYAFRGQRMAERAEAGRKLKNAKNAPSSCQPMSSPSIMQSAPCERNARKRTLNRA